MFRNIRWTNYGIFITITLIVYYATIGCLFYFNQLKQIFSGGSNLLLNKKAAIKVATDIKRERAISDEENFHQDDLHALVQKFMNEINTTLEHASTNNLIKQEILYALQKIANHYPEIRNSPLKSFITKYILIECDNYCSIHLGEDELKSVWAN
jgi:hypothetical protein